MQDNIKSYYQILFGKQLKSARLEKKLSQENLALIAGLDRTYISSCERGARNISLINIIKLAQALDITPTQLLTDERNHKNEP